jgi:hypothetical protein
MEAFQHLKRSTEFVKSRAGNAFKNEVLQSADLPVSAFTCILWGSPHSTRRKYMYRLSYG